MGPLSRPFVRSGQWSQTTAGMFQPAARLTAIRRTLLFVYLGGVNPAPPVLPGPPSAPGAPRPGLISGMDSGGGWYSFAHPAKHTLAKIVSTANRRMVVPSISSL